MNKQENHSDWPSKDSNRGDKKAEISGELKEIAPLLSSLKEKLPAPGTVEGLSQAQIEELKGLKSSILSKTTELDQAEMAEVPSKSRGVFQLPILARVFAAAAMLTAAFLIVKPMLQGTEAPPVATLEIYDNEFDRLFASLSDEDLQAIVTEQAEDFSLDYIQATFGSSEDEIDWTLLEEAEDAEILELINAEDFSDNEIELFL